MIKLVRTDVDAVTFRIRGDDGNDLDLEGASVAVLVAIGGISRTYAAVISDVAGKLATWITPAGDLPIGTGQLDLRLSWPDRRTKTTVQPFVIQVRDPIG
jgi:hypothetical protein